MTNITILDSTGATQNLATGSGAGSSGSPFQSQASVSIGGLADAAITNPASSGSVIAGLKGILTAVNNILVKGSATSANSSPVVIASDQGVIPVTSAPLITASGTMTRPADTTAYTFADLIANNTVAGSVTAITITSAARGTNTPGQVIGGILEKSGTGITNALFRAHIFSVNPVASAPTNGDNGAFAPANRAGYLGYIDFALTVFAFGDGVRARGVLGTGPINFTPVSGTANLQALLEARGAYTPASAEVFTLTLEVA